MTTNQTFDPNRNAAIKLSGLSNVEESRDRANEKLTKLLQSLEGRAIFQGGTIAIIDDHSLAVLGEFRKGVDKKRAEDALRKAFFTN